MKLLKLFLMTIILGGYCSMPIMVKADNIKVLDTARMRGTDSIDDILNSVDVTESQLKAIKEKYSSTLTDNQKKRIDALQVMINNLRKGKRPSENGLSDSQILMLRSIFNPKGNQDKIMRYQSRLKNVNSLEEFDKKVREIGINERKDYTK